MVKETKKRELQVGNMSFETIMKILSGWNEAETKKISRSKDGEMHAAAFLTQLKEIGDFVAGCEVSVREAKAKAAVALQDR